MYDQFHLLLIIQSRREAGICGCCWRQCFGRLLRAHSCSTQYRFYCRSCLCPRHPLRIRAVCAQCLCVQSLMCSSALTRPAIKLCRLLDVCLSAHGHPSTNPCLGCQANHNSVVHHLEPSQDICKSLPDMYSYVMLVNSEQDPVDGGMTTLQYIL